MNLWESILVSMEGLLANKLRSILTMLGMIFGVGAVIAMIAIGRGTGQQMLTRIQQMGTNVLIVQPGQSRTGAVMGGAGSNQSLTLADSNAIPLKCPSVNATAPESRGNAQVKYMDKNTSTTILGTTPDYLSVRNFSMQEGKFIANQDVLSSRKVAAIGPTTAQNLFGDASPVGKLIQIKGTQFMVIGLMATKGASGFGDADDQIFIPVTTAMNRMFGQKYVRAINVEAKSMAVMDQASDEVSVLLRKLHHLPAGGNSDDFQIRNQADIMDTANQMANSITLLLACIAGVSLLVGGIGIMNIMLVSVTERTREIGIRKALGARRRDIQIQFLVEAMVLSLIGGIIGILFGVLAAIIFSKMAQMPTSVTVSSMVLSFGVSAFIGMGFGLYPAWKASRLDPIDALRYE